MTAVMERALEAWEARLRCREVEAARIQAEAERLEAERVTERRQWFGRQLGQRFGLAVDPAGETVEIGGLRFALLRTGIGAEVCCPMCGATRVTRDLADLEELGMVLDADPAVWHDCPGPRLADRADLVAEIALE